jgi:transcriptional regulator
MKMLLILQLLKAGVKQGQIARVLKISDATMSRMLPTGLAKSFE